MAESEFVTALHEVTGIISEIPRHYLDVFPYFKELSPAEVLAHETAEVSERPTAPLVTPATPVIVPTKTEGSI